MIAVAQAVTDQKRNASVLHKTYRKDGAVAVAVAVVAAVWYYK